eukprot:403355069
MKHELKRKYSCTKYENNNIFTKFQLYFLVSFLLLNQSSATVFFDFSTGSSPYTDQIGSTAIIDYTNHPTDASNPTVTQFGGLYESQNMACQTLQENGNTEQASTYFNNNMHISMFVYIFDTVGEQTIVAKYGDSTTNGGQLTEHFRFYMDGDNLEIELTTASGPNDVNYQRRNRRYTNVNLESGWYFMAFDVQQRGGFFGSNQMDSDLYITHESNCGTLDKEQATSIQNSDWQDDLSYYFCFGNEQEQTGGNGSPATTYTAGSTPFSGYIRNFRAGPGPINATSEISGGYQCGGCTGNCSMCDTSGMCPFGAADPEFLIYDFTEGSLTGGSTWVGSQTAEKGTGPAFTLAEDWFVDTPYYVDNQGLYYDNSEMCSATGFTYGSIHSFSMGVWFKRNSGTSGSLVTLKQADDTVVFDLQGYPGGIMVTIGTETTSITCNYNPDIWVYALVTVTVRTATSSNICLKADNCDTCSSVDAIYTDPGNMKICTGGNGFMGTIKSLHFYNYGMSQDEASYTYQRGSCGTFNGNSCDQCSVVTGVCYSDCANNEYGSTCQSCDTNCSSCFNALNSQCYSCVKDTSTAIPFEQYVYAETICPYCGDSFILTTTPYLEECDDGNLLSNDGCSDMCQVEDMWVCTPSFQDIMGPSVCVFNCIDGTNSVTHTNGTIPIYLKDCDDDNAVTDDGCTPLCNINTGWKCKNGTNTGPDDCYEICGDGFDYHTYECDDGNLDDGDGCSSLCEVEDPDYTCQYGDFPWPDICTMACTVRGDDFGELPCIDSNNSPLDGCNEDCEVENGWECTLGSPNGIDSCFEVCGDSFDMDQYDCDDGNVNYPFSTLNDGCSWNQCTIDAGYDCRYSDWISRDACNEICGDGYNYGVQGQWNYLNNNECDDSNQRPGDGCGDQCRIERGWSCSGGNTGREDVCAPVCGDWKKIYHEHCDDGNSKNGDGCTSACIEEPGFRCTGGSHHWRDTCVELCGDGRNAGYFNCDDGNTVSGDGCSSTCKLEAGYQCIGGNNTYPDTCRELCGDGMNLGSVDCDDGNLLNTDGCNDVCEVETGYYCTHTTNGRDTCYEVCGDGIMLGSFSCDDGNFLDNDGCDKTCKIEQCWDCDGLSPTTCTIDPINTIGIQNATMVDDQSSVSIYFNNSVVLQSGFDIFKAIEVNVVGPLAPYNFTWYLKDADFIFNGVQTKEFKLMIDYLDTQLLGSEQENLTVCLKNVSQIKHFQCNKFMTDTPCWSFPMYYGKLAPSSYCQSAGIGTYGLYIVGGQVGLGLLFSMLGYSAGGAWDAFYLLQFTHLLPILSISAPSCGVYFYQEFKWSNMEEDSIAGWLRNAICNDGNATEMRPPTYNFYQNGIEYNNLAYNLADTLTIVMLALAVIPCISVIKLLLPNAVVIDNMDKFIKGRYLIAIINITYLKVATLTLINFTFFDTDTTTKAFNSYASIVMLLFISIVPFYYLAQTVFFYRELHSLKKAMEYQQVLQGEQNAQNKKVVEDKVKIIRNNFRNKVLFEEYKIDNFYQYGYMMQFCAQRLIFAIVVAKLHYNVDYQLFVITSMSALTMTYIATIQPYKYPFRNAIAILNEAGQFYIYTASMVWARSDNFCNMDFRGFVTPMAYAFTAFLGFQALAWLVCQFIFLSTQNGGKAPVSVEPEIVPKEISIKQQYKDLHTQVEEERKRQKNERMDDFKKQEEEKNKTEEQKKQEALAKTNKADDDNVGIVGLPPAGDDTMNQTIDKEDDDESEEEKSESLVSASQTQNNTTNQQTDQSGNDISEIRASSAADNSQSRNQDDDDDDEDEDDSVDLTRNQDETSQYDDTQKTDSQYESSFRQNNNKK